MIWRCKSCCILACVWLIAANVLASGPPSSPAEFLVPHRVAPWLKELASPDLVRELQLIADDQFIPDFQNLTSADTPPKGWSSFTLLNKGNLEPRGCAAAPRTCADFFFLRETHKATVGCHGSPFTFRMATRLSPFRDLRNTGACRRAQVTASTAWTSQSSAVRVRASSRPLLHSRSCAPYTRVRAPCSHTPAAD